MAIYQPGGRLSAGSARNSFSRCRILAGEPPLAVVRPGGPFRTTPIRPIQSCADDHDGDAATAARSAHAVAEYLISRALGPRAERRRAPGARGTRRSDRSRPWLYGRSRPDEPRDPWGDLRERSAHPGARSARLGARSARLGARSAPGARSAWSSAMGRFSDGPHVRRGAAASGNVRHDGCGTGRAAATTPCRIGQRVLSHGCRIVLWNRALQQSVLQRVHHGVVSRISVAHASFL